MKLRFASVWLVLTALGLFVPELRADESHIADEIAGLGDAAPAKRDAAAEALWAMGRAAEPALEAATKDGSLPSRANMCRRQSLSRLPTKCS